MAPNRRTNKTILAGAALLVIVVAAIVTAGCTAGTSTPGTVVGLTGVSWSLDSYLAENNTLVPALPGSEVSARFGDDGKVVGSAGCNHYGADYNLNGTALSVSPPISTKMYCGEPEGIMEQEARFLELLGSAAGCQIENGRLEITNASGATVLTFVKGVPADLAGTSWTLASLASEDGSMVPIITGTTVTAAFGADGTLGGSAGCNHYGADYTRSGANLTIGSLVRTEMYCENPKGIMEQEDRYLALLANVSTYRVEGDRMVLADEAGTDLLVFDRAAEVPDLPLAGTDWVLDGYSTGGDGVSSVIAGTTITAKFSPDGNVTGNAGCNHYGGGYLLDGANLSVSSLFSTLMYCEKPEGVMEQEGKYLGHLGNVSSYRVEGDRLILSDKTGTDLLFFVQAQKLPQAPLTGTLWTLESYSLEGDAVSSVIAGTTVTAEFAPDGNVTGSAGCNRYFAAYEVSGKTMTIGPAGSTKMYCGEPEGIMEQEARYLSLLESAAGHRIDGDRLDLLDEAGKTLLSYRAESVDQP
jgi:heat shock protein HslJ